MTPKNGPRRERMEDNVAYHMTTLQQAVYIAIFGLFSRNQLNNVKPSDDAALANIEVVGRRQRLAVFEKSICDYVPLYWTYKTPMQWARTVSDNRRIDNEDLVFFVYNVGKLATLPNIVTSDGNAACHATSFWRGWGAWDHLHWEALNFEGVCFDDYKRWKHAEILVQDYIPQNFAQAINVFSESAKQRLFTKIESARAIQLNLQESTQTSLLKDFENIDVIVDSKKYFVQS